MDSLTHIVLGACIGEATAGKSLGKRAMVLGAFAQTAPDLDFIAHFWLDKSDDILSHRGITHSLLFATIVTLLLAEISKRIFPTRPVTRIRWWLLFGVNLFTHIFIDSFNAYGTGWFEPFSDVRISFQVIFVADPFFSIWPFFAFLFLLISRSSNTKRKFGWMAGIGLSALYLTYASFNKLYIDKAVRKNLAERGITSNDYITTPTPLNSWLWFVVAKDTLAKGYYVGYRSVFDRDPRMEFTWFPRNDSLLNNISDKEEVKKLVRFAQGYYTVEKWNDTTVLNVLRFGQVAGWHNLRAKFAFHYFIDRPGANEIVTQRGRFEDWNRETLRSFIKRIRGD